MVEAQFRVIIIFEGKRVFPELKMIVLRPLKRFYTTLWATSGKGSDTINVINTWKTSESSIKGDSVLIVDLPHHHFSIIPTNLPLYLPLLSYNRPLSSTRYRLVGLLRVGPRVLRFSPHCSRFLILNLNLHVVAEWRERVRHCVV